MNNKEVRKARTGLGLSQSQFAKLTGVAGSRTVRKWEAGDAPVPAVVRSILAFIKMLTPTQRKEALAKLTK